MKFASLFLVISSLATSLVFADQQVDNFTTSAPSASTSSISLTACGSDDDCDDGLACTKDECKDGQCINTSEFCKYYYKCFGHVFACGFGKNPTVEDINKAGCSFKGRDIEEVIDLGENCEKAAEIPKICDTSHGPRRLTSYAYMPCKKTGCKKTRMEYKPIQLTCVDGRRLSFLRA